jgi:hypothetical protein
VADRDFTILDMPQRSPEWFNARLGRLTGSTAGKMLARIAGGREGADCKNLRMRLILERLTGKSQEKSTFVSDAMQAGIDREPDAVAAYEAQSGLLIERTGFLVHSELMAGCSLDGHVDDFDVLVSVKCRQPQAHWEFLRSSAVPNDAWWQMAHELWLTDALEHHYVSFNPDFPEHIQLRATVYTRDKFDLAKYDQEARAFLEGVDTELRMMHGWKGAA